MGALYECLQYEILTHQESHLPLPQSHPSSNCPVIKPCLPAFRVPLQRDFFSLAPLMLGAFSSLYVLKVSTPSFL